MSDSHPADVHLHIVTLQFHSLIGKNRCSRVRRYIYEQLIKANSPFSFFPGIVLFPRHPSGFQPKEETSLSDMQKDSNGLIPFFVFYLQSCHFKFLFIFQGFLILLYCTFNMLRNLRHRGKLPFRENKLLEWKKCERWN